MRRFVLLILVLALVMPGCSLITVNVRPGLEPLEEKVLSGGKGGAKVLLIAIEGVISEEREKSGPLSLKEEVGMIPLLTEELDKAAKDDAVKAVVLKVNSPGGAVTASDIIYHELISFKRRTSKPLVVVMTGLAASGGYYVSCAADRIIAHPTTITGSIGVLALKISAADLLNKIGVANETITAGDKKDMVSPLRPLTAEERVIFKGIIDDLDARFLEVVRLARKPRPDQIATFSDARILDAAMALKLGLVDKLGYMDDAIEEAKDLAKIEDARVVTYARPGQYRNNIYSVTGPPKEPTMLGFDTQWLSSFTPGVHFMYLWTP
ncbi:MAG: signal peptide peptidase SppA [Pseudomonadota bacterium]